MAEQVFRSPGFFEREIDLAPQVKKPTGTPAAIIGTAQKGPAFVPVTIGSFEDFKVKFGTLDPDMFGPYAVREFLKHKTACTYMRVLGAGSNDTDSDMTTTKKKGVVKNAGFKVVSSATPAGQGRHQGAVQFICARHFLSSSESLAFPVFTDNDSFDTGDHAGEDTGEYVNLVRAMVMCASGTRMMVMNGDEATPTALGDNLDDLATLSGGLFKLVISSSTPGFSKTDNLTGIKILSASLDPANDNYLSKILNTDPSRFGPEEHLLYLDFPIEEELASVVVERGAIAIASGSTNTTSTGGDTSETFRNLYGRYDTRFTTSRTPWIISQPFGDEEFNLFYFETLSDGAWASDQYKISIIDVKKSTNPSDPYGTFTVLVRNFDDVDTSQQVLEQYTNCSLDKNSERYIAKVIGDYKAHFNFDAEDKDDRRVVVSGKYANKSTFVRVVMNSAVEKRTIPSKSLPFGFRGVPVLKTSDSLTDRPASGLAVKGTTYGGSKGRRLGFMSGALAPAGSANTISAVHSRLSGSIVPPLPFRFKVTKGEITHVNDDSWAGKPTSNEMVDTRFCWGVKFERFPRTGSMTNARLNPNGSSVTNDLVRTFTKFMGIEKLETTVSGTGKDVFCNNKFTLARVALGNNIDTGDTLVSVVNSEVTGTAKEHILEAAYIRNGQPDPTTYTVSDGIRTSRLTLASLVHLTSSVYFNRFSTYNKFSTIFYGGFDGLNMLDKNAAKMNDRSASSDMDGGAFSSFESPGLSDSDGNSVNIAGPGKTNNAVASYRKASEIMTDEMMTRSNILAIPGIRDTFVSDYAAENTKALGMQIYLMDPVEYDEDGNRLWDESTEKPDVRYTAEQFDSRAIDNSYVSSYFPDVWIDDPVNNTKVKVPPSIPAIAALAFNDKVSYPWFAPAGFNRGALAFVSNIDVRLNAADRDMLYDSRLNPIASFPRGGFVIFGQKTLQQAQSALDRVNVRRLMLELKRLVINVAKRFVFEQNTSATRSRFVGQVAPLLALIQAQAGIEKFSIIMDDTNNSAEDVDNNQLNGRIVVVPTRAIEFIAIDFIIDRSGASFV